MNEMKCPKCDSTDIRLYSNYNKKLKKEEWFNGCNVCDWENINIKETIDHADEKRVLAEGKTIE